MSDDSPDPLELDAMHGGDADLGEAWAQLVGEPDSAAAWTAASERRARMDRFAAVAIGRPWLAEALLAARRAARRWASVVRAPLGATVSSDPLLGLLDAESASRSIEIAAGTVRVEPVALREDVSLLAPPGTHARYLAPDGWWDLPSARWRMEAGDAPVVLAAVLDDSSEEPRGALPPGDRVVATLILIERAQGENDE
jgi:hypothetical protein